MSDRTFGHKKANTSTFSNPSLVSPHTPTLANPVRSFGLPTNNVIQTAIKESTNLQDTQAGDEQSLLSEAIHQRSFGHDISRIPLRRPQAKLTVGEPGDKYEQQAEQVANQVMRMVVPQKFNASTVKPVQDSLQQKCAGGGEEQEQIGNSASNLITTRIQRSDTDYPSYSEEMTDSSTTDLPPELDSKTVEGELNLSKPPSIKISLKDVSQSPEYIDLPDQPETPDTLMAKPDSGVIQRDDPPGLGLDFQLAVPWSLSVTALCRNCNLLQFKNFLGQGNALEIGHEPQIQLSIDPNAQIASQLAFPLLNQHIQLFNGSLVSELEASLSPIWTINPSEKSSTAGGQGQLQLHIYKGLSITGSFSGSYMPPKRDDSGNEIKGHLEFNPGTSVLYSVTF